MAPSKAAYRLAFAAFLVLHGIMWSHSRYASTGSVTALPTLLKRTTDATPYQDASQCAPLSVPVSDQCQHVKDFCHATPTFLSIGYTQSYFCASPGTRPFIFLGYVLWLAFLFSTLGITASDFFCPNLGTIAERLGLDENVAGVTFLAFGNGSPDVFSTFSAMKAGSGPLAIGELLGAASFIVSVVAGTMCIIRPFSVEPRPFLRDVGFFTAAVALLLVILWDEEIRTWEAASLVALYALYVVVVIVGTWWDKRQFRRKHLESIARGEYAAEEMPEPYRDDPSSEHLSTSPPFNRVRAHSSPGAIPSSLNMIGQPTRSSASTRSHSRSPSPTSRTSHMPSFSLAGALEFRQVVASLQHQSAGAALSAFESPLSPYAGGHYHAHGLSRRPSYQSSASAHSTDTFETALPLHSRSPLSRTISLQESGEGLERNTSSAPPNISVSSPSQQNIPLINTVPATPDSESSFDANRLTMRTQQAFHRSPSSKRQRAAHAVRKTLHVLFPTLHSFREKSFPGKVASSLAAPAVLALTVTLPVHVTSRSHRASEEKLPFSGPIDVPEGRLVDFEEEGTGVERMLTAEEEDSHSSDIDISEELKFNKFLMASQMLLGPLFCAAVLFSGLSAKKEGLILGFVAIAGAVASGLVLVFAERGEEPSAQMARCFMGFIVAIVWIMAIADEVVNVLKTFGFIFGLSDAIIGLTIFAVGNSLADFVANISVASFAPLMGFAACFGGPMLNILLGVGLSGSYVIRSLNEGQPFPLKFSSTLVVSTVGLLVLLLATMICVPMRSYHLDRRWGVGLVVSYVVIMTLNVGVEVNRK